MKATLTIDKGGPGSGFHGHAGRPGEVGGSVSDKGNVDPYIAGIKEYIDNLSEEKSNEVLTEYDVVISNSQLEQDQMDIESMLLECRVCVRADRTVLDDILKDGRIKSQFETQTSGGFIDKDNEVRTEVEMALFGLSEDSDVTKRPIYGYLADNVNASHNIASYYGDVIFEMNSDIRDRTTITGHDSLTSIKFPTAPSFLTNPKWVSMLTDNGRISKDYPSDRLFGYIETQIHGGVSMKDVKRIWLTGSTTNPGMKYMINDMYPDIDVQYYNTVDDIQFPD
jgi:hypothetical protein